MDWIEPLRDALQSTGGSFLIGVLVLVLGSSAILSEKTAKEKFGAIGLIAGWIQRRKEAAALQEEELLNRRTADLWEEIRRVDEARSRDRQVLMQEILDLRTSERLKHRYTVWAAKRVRDLEIWAATSGLQLPQPKILPFWSGLRSMTLVMRVRMRRKVRVMNESWAIGPTWQTDEAGNFILPEHTLGWGS